MPNKRKHSKKPTYQLEIAKERIERLFSLAQKKRESREAAELVRKAVTISKRYKVPIPADLKKTYCKKCFSLYLNNSTTRTSAKTKSIGTRCKSCGTVRRLPLKKHSDINNT